ncbi:MAG TPA: SPFH domain-containing protein [Gaiellaceae bacterium]|jgi:uncharacterized membrane protein YqiK
MVLGVVIIVVLIVAAVGFVGVKSATYVGPTEIGLPIKRFGAKLGDGGVIAFNGEAGYQAELLMPGWRFRLWPVFRIDKYSWVQVPAGGIGVVIAQVGKPLPIGAKSAEYKEVFGDFRDIRSFLENGGEKGVQRAVLPPGTLAPIHPIAFLVITSQKVYGAPVSPDVPVVGNTGKYGPASFGLRPEHLGVVNITPTQEGTDVIGVITALEGKPLAKGDIASRLGGYGDIRQMEEEKKPVAEVIGALIGSKNDLHNNYQDFQAFLDHGGRIGLQHDPLLYGAYLLNPFLVQVELVPMTVVQQGEVAVIKSYVGLPTQDTSGAGFKFGSMVNPGHQGIWNEPLRTGKYPLNPRIYAAEIVPTSILTLNWATAASEAHDLDKSLNPISAKSREGFEFDIDLQVLIHVPDTHAAQVISMVGTMKNLVNEVLESAVGNYFRNTLQGLPAVTFIETRDDVQKEAEEYIRAYLSRYEVETRGVYIQDVVLPAQLVDVLTAREIARQQQTTYEQERTAEEKRVELEQVRGTAAMQAELAKSSVSIKIKQNDAEGRKADAAGAAAYAKTTGEADAHVVQVKGEAQAHVVKATGEAEAAAIEAQGVARAIGYEKQREALGPEATALVAVFSEIGDGHVKIVPDVLVGGGGGPLDGLAAMLTRQIARDGIEGLSANGDEQQEQAPAKKSPTSSAS